jgi:hypothetical protein
MLKGGATPKSDEESVGNISVCTFFFGGLARGFENRSRIPDLLQRIGVQSDPSFSKDTILTS